MMKREENVFLDTGWYMPKKEEDGGRGWLAQMNITYVYAS